MKIILITLKKILFWSYERGSWQYDVMCVLILAFIFLSPNSIFESRRAATPLIVRGDEIGQIDPNDIGADAKSTSARYANAISVSRIEKVEDSSGETTYVVWLK
jgi:hypothetical protein